VSPTGGTACYFEDFIKGDATYSTVFNTYVHIPYQDYDIDLDKIEQISPSGAGVSLQGQYHYNVWCFAEDDWHIESPNAASTSINFASSNNANQPKKVDYTHAQAVSVSIGSVLTLDTTPPAFTSIQGTMYSETVLTMTMQLDETGTIWCMPLRTGFAEPSVNEILQNNEYNLACGTSPCTVTMQGLDAKTVYDIWCYAEDDNVYPQKPNGQKFTTGQATTLTTQDTTPPILTIVSAESPISTDIRVKVKMEEPGTVWCYSWPTATAYGTVNYDTVVAGGFASYVGTGQTPGGSINTNVEVVVTGLVAETQYDTYCTARDTSTLPSVNKLDATTTQATLPAIGQITTLDQSPPEFIKLGAQATDENTIQVTFQCNEPCRSYCRVTRSDSGESTLSINRILKANFYADWTSGDATININRLEDDSALALLERGTLYDTYCWIRDEALQHSCYAYGAGATCETFPKPNYQGQVYTDTAYGNAPPASSSSPNGGKMLHVRTQDNTAPLVIVVEAESTEDNSITVTLQLDEPGTAYCRAYAGSTYSGTNAALYTDLTTGVSSPASVVYSNTVTNYNNIYKNFEVKISDLTMETLYYVYCVAEDDEYVEGANTILPAPSANNQALGILTEAAGRFTLDLTPPIITMVSISSTSETTATVTVTLDEPGTVWCKAVRDQFDPPTINQVIAASFYSLTLSTSSFTVLVDNLVRDTEYDMYCHARDRGTEVSNNVPAGNPGNDITYSAMLDTKRDIHTMGDSSGPQITATSPILGATGVSTQPLVQITFNEDIQVPTSCQTPATCLVTFTPSSGTTLTLDVNDVNTGVCSGQATIGISNNVLSMDFGACGGTNLGNSNTYYVNFVSGVFADTSLNQNPVPAFGSGNSYYWTTVATR
jgi:hypothetical protein